MKPEDMSPMEIMKELLRCLNLILNQKKQNNYSLVRNQFAWLTTQEEAINFFQDNGMVSDLCITLQDVSEIDFKNILEIDVKTMNKRFKLWKLEQQNIA